MSARLFGGVVTCFASLAAGAAWAEPVLALAPGAGPAPQTPVAVVLTDLDPETAYWVTIVPAIAEPGAYEEFHYVEAAKRAELSFAGLPPDSYEIRLHEQSGGDPVVARLALDLGAAPATPLVSDATRAFATAYGLTGDWTGSYVCPDGAADVTLTLWNGSYDNRFDGRMRATLTDGPDAGASGEWPVYAESTPKHGLVGLGFESPRKEPRPGYGMARLSEARLSEDGARIEGGSFLRHGCSDFTLVRAPVAPPEEAAVETAALAQRGFWGTWSGGYSCSGIETSLDLDFMMDAASGRLEARWRYRGGDARRAFAGEAVFRALDASGGAVELQPLRWIEQPNGHTASPTTLRIGPDGKRLQGTIEGCERLVAERVGEPPALPDPEADVVSASARATLASLEGAWEGETSCYGADHLMRLDLSGLAAGRPEGMFRHVAVDGPALAQLRLALKPRADGSLAAAEAERLQYALHHPVYTPVEVAAEGEDLRVRFDGTACTPATISRPIDPEPLTIAGEARDAPAGAVLVLSEDGRSLRPAPAAQACAALAAWSEALAPQERALNRAGGWNGWPGLFAEARFVPVFGAPYATLSGSPDIGRLVKPLAQRDCRAHGQSFDPELVTVIDAAFGLGRNTDFGSDHHRFRRAAAQANSAAAGLPALLAEIEAIPVAPDAAAALDTLRTTLDPKVTLLGATDRAQVAAALDARAEAIMRSAEDDHLARLADGRTPVTLATLGRAEDILAARASADAADWRTRLHPQATALADEFLAPGASRQDRESFASLSAFPAIADRLAALDRDDAAATDERLQAIDAQIAAAERIEALRPLRAELDALAADTATADRTARPFMAFDRRAEALVADAVAQLPAAAPARPPAGAAPSGIKQSAFVAALLAGDRGSAYHADRDFALIYLQQMTSVFRDYCPAALPADLQTQIASQFMDMDALTGGRDAMAAAGLQALADGIIMLADPGAAISQAIRTDEILLVADGDAQILLNSYRCTGPELRAFFENARAYVVDPAEGVETDALRMGDVCRAALADDMTSRDTMAYCDCAGATLDQALNDNAKRYLRAEPAVHYRQLGLFARAADRQIQSCRR